MGSHPPTWHPTQLATGVLTPGVKKWPGGEADHSTAASNEVKNEWSYNPIPPPSFYFMHPNHMWVEQ